MPTTFMDLMNWVFQNYLDSILFVFNANMLVYSKSDDEHMGHMRIVLQVLKVHHVFAKYSKCRFLLKSVAFHAHIVSNEGIEVDLKKMKVVN